MSFDAANSVVQKASSPAGVVQENTVQNKPERTLEPHSLALFVQAKLTVGAPDDPYEKEADAMADLVMRMPEQNSVQRKCLHCEEEEQVKRKPLSASISSFIQTKTENNTPVVSDSLSQSIQSSKGGGSSLDEGTKTFMSNRFDTDFGSVKIHTDGEAVQMNRRLGAKAFTVGQDVYFNQEQYQPGSTEGKHLLAHELTHVIQQGPTVKQNNIPVIQKNGEDDPVQSAISDVYEALDGWTDSDDSFAIWLRFDSTDRTTTDRIVNGVASLSGYSVDQTMGWLHSDMVTADWNRLLGHFISVNAYRTDRLIAGQVYSYLSGFTSDSNSNSILAIYAGGTPVTGDLLGRSLVQLENVTGYTENDATEYLFGDLTLLDAHKLSLHFFNSNDTKATGYAAYWVAAKVRDLISGYTGLADSTAIVENFNRVPVDLRSIVLFELEKICQEKWEEPAAAALMEDMQQEDYEQLRVLMPGLLPVYNIEKNWLKGGWDKIMVGFDYLASLIEYAVCGLIGIIWGVITVVIDVIVAIVDVGIAVVDILGMIVYFVSGGQFCKENKDRVWAFFSAMGQLFDAPGDALGAMWEELTMESSLIEGPFSACQKAIFWTSRIINLLVNIVLILWGGYGLVKIALKGIETVVTLALAGELIGALKALPDKMWSAIKKLPAATSKAVLAGGSRVVGLIKNPVEIIGTVRNTLTAIRMAAEDESYFKFLRKQFGKAIEGESKFWQERREFWKRETETIEGGVSHTENKLVAAVETTVDDPAKAETLIAEAEAEAKAGKAKADELMDDVNGKNAAEEPTKPGNADDPGKKKEESVPGKELKVKAEEPSLDGERKVQIDEAGKCNVCASPCDEIKKKYKAAIDRVQGRNFNTELDAIEANAVLTPEQKMPLFKALEQELDDIQDVLKIMDDAKTKKFRKAGNYHADTRHNMSDAIVKEIISNPEGIYLSESGNQFIYHKGGDMAVIRATPRSTKGNAVTAYGSSGIKGESGARALGGLPTDPAPAITDAMITGGQIPDGAGGFIPPARKIWP